MEELSEQKSSESQNEVKKHNHVGILGGLTLLSLPMMALAAIIGLVKALDFIGEDTEADDSKSSEVDIL